MPITGRKVYCDIKGCKEELQEKEFGLGFPEWGQLKGIVLDGKPDPMLCPLHKSMTADFIDEIEVIQK